MLSLCDAQGVPCNGTRARPRLCRPPHSHQGDCPLTQSNEIILGEVMLKMNHFLTIPWRRPGTFLLDLVVRSHPSSTIGQVEGFTPHRQSHAPARPPSPSKQKHMTESPHLIQSWPGRLQQHLSRRNIRILSSCSSLASNSLEAWIPPKIAPTQVQLLFGQGTIYIWWCRNSSTVDAQ